MTEKKKKVLFNSIYSFPSPRIYIFAFTVMFLSGRRGGRSGYVIPIILKVHAELKYNYTLTTKF